MEQRLEQSSIFTINATAGLGGIPKIFCTDFIRFSSDTEIIAITFSSALTFTTGTNFGLSCVARITSFQLDATGTALVSSINGPGFGTAIEGNSDILLAHMAASPNTPADSVSNKVQGIVYPKELRPKMNSSMGVGIFWFSSALVTTQALATIYYRRL